MKALNKYVLISAEKQSETTKGGIYLAHQGNSSFLWGNVVSIGDTVEKTELVVGDRVGFSGYQASTIEVNDEKLLIVKLDDVLVVDK